MAHHTHNINQDLIMINLFGQAGNFTLIGIQVTLTSKERMAILIKG